MPNVKGQVTKVHAKTNVPMKKGDLLLEINSAPYQFALDQAAAQLQASQEALKQAEAGVDVAKASVESAEAGIQQATASVSQAKAAVTNASAGITRAKAGVANAEAGVLKAKASNDLAKTEEQIAVNLQKTDAGAIRSFRVTQAIQSRKAADATLQAEATEVDEAQSSDAKFNLEQCHMLASADGYVVAWAVQEGTMLVPMPMAADGTFINTQTTFIAASFHQNWPCSTVS